MLTSTHLHSFCRTILHITSSLGREEVLQCIHEQQQLTKSSLQIKDKESGWTPLHRAVYYGQVGCAVFIHKVAVASFNYSVFIEFVQAGICKSHVPGSTHSNALYYFFLIYIASYIFINYVMVSTLRIILSYCFLLRNIPSSYFLLGLPRQFLWVIYTYS